MVGKEARMKTMTIAALLLVLDAISWAAVRVDSYSGSFRAGTVVISGAGFGVKAPAAPLVWADFENVSLQPTSLGQRLTWNEIENLNISSENGRPGSALCARGTWGPGRQSFSFRLDKRFWSRIYHYQKRYYTHPSTGNQKFWRLWPESGLNNFLAAYLLGEGIAYNEVDTGNPDRYIGAPYRPGKWLTEEFTWFHSGGSGRYRDGTQALGSGVWTYTRDGTFVQRMESVNNGGNTLVQLRTDNFTDSSHLAPNGASVYMDDIYIDDTLARVMLGDKPTLAQSTQREIQLPFLWADGSITITPRASAWPDGQTVYLYVFDANGAFNLSGLPVVLGGFQPENVRPSFPRALRIR